MLKKKGKKLVSLKSIIYDTYNTCLEVNFELVMWEIAFFTGIESNLSEFLFSKWKE